MIAPLGGNSRIQIKKDPIDWINCSESGRNSRSQESRRLNWIQPTGFINPNQAETPDFKNPSDQIRANSILKKAHLCLKCYELKAHQTQFVQALKSELEKRIRVYIGFRLDDLETDKLTLSLSLPSLGFHSYGHLSPLLGLGAMFPL